MRLSRARRLALLGATCFALAAPAGALGAEAPCEGDECQGPPPAPEEVIPATAVVVGPENPAVRFPKGEGAKQKAKPKRSHKGRKGSKRGAKR